MKENKKRATLMNVNRIEDSASSEMNSRKAQHERAIGSEKRTRKIRKIHSQALAEHVKIVEQQMQ